MQNFKFQGITVSVIISLMLFVVSSFTNSVNGAENIPECNTEIVAKGTPKKGVKKSVGKKKKAPVAKKRVTKKVTKKKRSKKAKRRVVYYDDDDSDAEEEAYEAGHAFGVEDKQNGTRIHECIVYGNGSHQEDYEDGYYDGYFSTPDPKKGKKKYR